MHSLTLLTSPGCENCGTIRNYLKFDLKIDFTELDLSRPGFAWLAVRVKEERKGLPALMHENQILTVGNSKVKALQALRDWGLVEARPKVEDLFLRPRTGE